MGCIGRLRVNTAHTTRGSLALRGAGEIVVVIDRSGRNEKGGREGDGGDVGGGGLLMSKPCLISLPTTTKRLDRAVCVCVT